MLEVDENILKYNPAEKGIKVPFAIYTGTQSLLDNIDTCHKNSQRSSLT